MMEFQKAFWIYYNISGIRLKQREIKNSKGYKKITGIKFNLQEVKDAIAPGAIGTFIKAKKKKSIWKKVIL